MNELVYLKNNDAFTEHYKEIYKDCKARLETVSQLAFLEVSA